MNESAPHTLLSKVIGSILLLVSLVLFSRLFPRLPIRRRRGVAFICFVFGSLPFTDYIPQRVMTALLIVIPLIDFVKNVRLIRSRLLARSKRLKKDPWENR